MSFISDQLRALDLKLDRLLSGYPTSEPSSPKTKNEKYLLEETPRIQLLKKIIKQLSLAIAHSSSHAGPPISREKLSRLLTDAAISRYEADDRDLEPQKAYEQDLEWLLLGKAAILVFGLTLHVLLTQTLPLTQDLFYWDEVLSSYRYTILYGIQIFPVWLTGFSKEIYREAMNKFQDLKEIKPENAQQITEDNRSITFYGIVRNSLRDHSQQWHRRILLNTPFYVIRHDVRKKQASIRRLREMQACALGILIGETLDFDSVKENEDCKRIIVRGVFLMKNILRNVSAVSQFTVAEFEDLIFRKSKSEEETTESPAFPDGRKNRQTWILSQQLQNILNIHLPAQEQAAMRLVKIHGRPSPVVRYWAPTIVLLLTSSTTLSYVTNRKAEIRVWIQEAGATVVDFWRNWVIEPIKNMLATIRHDADSEVALMSQRSLAADMESLERMVVEFAIDNPDVCFDDPVQSLTPENLEAIRQHVKEGDLTPVLRAYERDLRRPFKGAIKGELLRALLIQIQKTKVDVEVAISGIDKLLKSQQLVFALLGVTPGILGTWATVRWLARVLGGRKYIRRGKDSEAITRILRNIDRILSNASQERDLLPYQEQGLILCEVYVLRELAGKFLPRHLFGDFVEETEDLANIHSGIRKQLRAVERIRWAYSRWIH